MLILILHNAHEAMLRQIAILGGAAMPYMGLPLHRSGDNPFDPSQLSEFPSCSAQGAAPLQGVHMVSKLHRANCLYAAPLFTMP